MKQIRATREYMCVGVDHQNAMEGFACRVVIWASIIRQFPAKSTECERRGGA
jgi:hypothetical protein